MLDHCALNHSWVEYWSKEARRTPEVRAVFQQSLPEAICGPSANPNPEAHGALPVPGQGRLGKPWRCQDFHTEHFWCVFFQCALCLSAPFPHRECQTAHIFIGMAFSKIGVGLGWPQGCSFRLLLSLSCGATWQPSLSRAADQTTGYRRAVRFCWLSGH